MSGKRPPRLSAEPATSERWQDLEQVFGPRGAYSSCWCMYWRVKRAEFDAMGPKKRRTAFRGLTRKDPAPGILIYDQRKRGESIPFAWCSLGPRDGFPVLQRSPFLRPVDELPTWSIVCFYIRPEYQGQGLYRHVVAQSVDYARRSGAPRIEAYPREGKYDGMDAYMGIAEVYRSLGFEEVARRKADRPVLRLEL